MRGRGRVTNQRLGAAETDGELAHRELVEKCEGFAFAASDVERERRARRGRLALEHRFARVVVGEEAEIRSEEHTSELQSHSDLVCRLLLEKKKKADLPKRR